jgi:hypothetical protein
MLRALLGNTNDSDETLDVYIGMAKNAILRHAYPYEDIAGVEFPARYDDLAVQIAQSMYLRIGAEGESAHSENGVSRQFLTDGIPKSLLAQITPNVGTPQ